MAGLQTTQSNLQRTRILQAAQTVLVQFGYAGLTQQRVIESLDLTRGGLQHHFPTKQKLLDALFDQALKDFDGVFHEVLASEAEGPSRNLRAYIKVARGDEFRRRVSGRALVLLYLGDAAYQAIWSRHLANLLMTDELEPDVQLVGRLFAEGLWYAYVLGPAPNAAMADAAMEAVLRLLDQQALNQDPITEAAQFAG